MPFNEDNTELQTLVTPATDETGQAVPAPIPHATDQTVQTDEDAQPTADVDTPPAVDGDGADAAKTEEQLKQEKWEHEKRSMAGKIAAIEREKAQYQRQERERLQIIEELHNPDKSIDAIAKLAINPTQYDEVRKYVPALRDMDHAEFLNNIKELEAPQRNQVESKKQLAEAQINAQEAIELERIKARQQAALEYKIPQFGQLANENQQLAKMQYETALRAAYTKAEFLINRGSDVTPETFEQMVTNELISMFPTGYIQNTQAAPTVQRIVAGATTQSPSRTEPKLSEADRELYNELVDSFKGRLGEKEAHARAMQIINS